MPSLHFEHIFIYNDSLDFSDLLEEQSTVSNLRLFDTNNLYQLLQYTKELSPNILVINQDSIKNSLSETLDYLYVKSQNYPQAIILIKNGSQNFLTDQRISHYLNFPEDKEKFRDITESYDYGNKNHQVLLLSSFSDKREKLPQSLSAQNIYYFEVHTIAAAKYYLQKNTPQIICVQSIPKFAEVSRQLTHNRIFYVDIGQDITEIRHFLN